jgi:hypothetical protein
LVGRNPISVSFSYTPVEENIVNIHEELEFHWAQDFILESHNNGVISYNYIIYYDADTQSHHLDTEYNYTISQLTGRKFWGRIMLVDLNPDLPVIRYLFPEEFHSL